MAFKMTLRIEQAPTKEWFAIDDDTYDGAPDAHHMMGWGDTPEEAAEDLVRMYRERAEAQADQHEAEAQRRAECPYTEAEIQRSQDTLERLFGFKP